MPHVKRLKQTSFGSRRTYVGEGFSQRYCGSIPTPRARYRSGVAATQAIPGGHASSRVAASPGSREDAVIYYAGDRTTHPEAHRSGGNALSERLSNCVVFTYKHSHRFGDESQKRDGKWSLSWLRPVETRSASAAIMVVKATTRRKEIHPPRSACEGRFLDSSRL